MISKLQKQETMLPQQNQKEATIGSRFDQIDKRWTVVQDAFRIEDVERSQDLYILKEQLQERKTKVMSIEQRKAEILGNTLRKISQNASESKQNLAKLFQTEAQFRIQHLDKKNDFIQTYLNNGSTFNSNLQQYANNKIKDVCSKLESIDAANVAKTQQTVKIIKQEVIGQAKANFDKEKEKYNQLLAKMTNDANKSMDELRDLLQATRKQREEKEVKLRLMISGLLDQLTKLSDTEAKQGEITYDCLLKLLEECCAKIQEAQLK